MLFTRIFLMTESIIIIILKNIDEKRSNYEHKRKTKKAIYKIFRLRNN